VITGEFAVDQTLENCQLNFYFPLSHLLNFILNYNDLDPGDHRDYFYCYVTFDTQTINDW